MQNASHPTIFSRKPPTLFSSLPIRPRGRDAASCDINACMRSVLTLTALVALCALRLMSEPVHLLCNHLANPIGLDSPKPRLSWQSDNIERNWKQSAYRILIASSEKTIGEQTGDVWDSGKVKSAQSLGIIYGGPKLVARGRYFWTVQVWDSADKASKPSPSAWWEMGLLSSSDWQAKWITRANPDEGADRAAMKWLALPQGIQNLPAKTSGTIKKTFQLKSVPRSAALFTIGRGDFIASVNGHEVANKADWNDFDRKDVTKELIAGQNTIELRLTSHTPSPYEPPANFHPTVVAALLKLRAADGSLTRIGSDSTWGRVAGDLTDESLTVPGPLPQPAALFRQRFKVDDTVNSATLYVTALGSYRTTINGQMPDGSLLTPGFTDYRKHLAYQTYDVTRLIRHGENAIGLMLGDGWYSSPLTWNGNRFYAPPNRAMAQLELHYANGKNTTAVMTDDNWRTAESPVEFSQIYAGEDYDARNEKSGWDQVKFQDADWAKASIGEAPTAKLIGLLAEPVHVNSDLKPVSVKAGPAGTFVYDFGQNMVGWAQLKVRGAAGTRVRMRFAEILSPDGSIYRENLRNADATDTYTLKGKGDETYSPSFTFHGFRYVELTGYPDVPTLDSLTGKVVGSLEEPFSGRLETSSELVNKMWKIGLWVSAATSSAFLPTVRNAMSAWVGWVMRASSGGPAVTTLISRLLPASSCSTLWMRRMTKAILPMYRPTYFMQTAKAERVRRAGAMPVSFCLILHGCNMAIPVSLMTTGMPCSVSCSTF